MLEDKIKWFKSALAEREERIKRTLWQGDLVLQYEIEYLKDKINQLLNNPKGE